MREDKAKITDGGNAHLQAFVRPKCFPTPPNLPIACSKHTPQSWLCCHVFFSYSFSLSIVSIFQTFRAFSTRCFVRIPATTAISKASATTYTDSMAQYCAMRSPVFEQAPHMFPPSLRQGRSVNIHRPSQSRGRRGTMLPVLYT
jgi:hypothetical protein